MISRALVARSGRLARPGPSMSGDPALALSPCVRAAAAYALCAHAAVACALLGSLPSGGLRLSGAFRPPGSRHHERLLVRSDLESKWRRSRRAVPISLSILLYFARCCIFAGGALRCEGISPRRHLTSRLPDALAVKERPTSPPPPPGGGPGRSSASSGRVGETSSGT